jgi:hypothetical protein
MIHLGNEEYCDGSAQSIYPWSQKNPLLGKHIPEVTHSTTELQLLSGERFVATDETEKNRHGDFYEGHVTVV